jgi:hypothetical protein
LHAGNAVMKRKPHSLSSILTCWVLLVSLLSAYLIHPSYFGAIEETDLTEVEKEKDGEEKEKETENRLVGLISELTFSATSEPQQLAIASHAHELFSMDKDKLYVLFHQFKFHLG